MKKFALFLALIGLAAASCTKDSVSSTSNENDVRAKLIAQKYHLTLIENNSKPLTKSFATFDEFENFLKTRNKKVSVKGEGVVTSSNGKYGTIRTMAEYTLVGSTYAATIHFSGFTSYPDLLSLSWELGGSASSQLYYSGSNYGTWAYTQITGADINNQITVLGIYSETFGVGGLYTYTNNYNYRYDSGTWGGGHIYGYASFAPLGE